MKHAIAYLAFAPAAALARGGIHHGSSGGNTGGGGGFFGTMFAIIGVVYAVYWIIKLIRGR